MAVYETTWRNKFLTLEATSIEEMASILEAAAGSLRDMAAGGIRLDGGQGDDYARLVTEDAEVAAKFGLEIQENDENQDDEEDDLEQTGGILTT